MMETFCYFFPARSSAQTITLALHSLPLNHIPKCHTCTSFKYLQDSTSSLDSLFQCFIALLQRKDSLLWPYVRPLSLVLSLVPGRRPQQPPHQNLLSGVIEIKSPLRFLFSRQLQQLLLLRFVLQPFPSSIALLWICSSTSISFLCRVAQNPGHRT